MRRIIQGSLLLAIVVGVTVAGTGAFFNDSESSTGNVFAAGAIDLTVDHAAASYNGESCVEECVPTGQDLVENGGFELPSLNSGGWAIYQTIPGWKTESGDGIEIQNNAAGAPHGGGQLVELDSTNSSAMSQTITTVPGERYRLTFWHSPRPNRPAGDNTIDYEVQVESGGATILNGQVGAAAAGGGSTNWTEYTYDFIAVDNATKIIFSDAGSSNSYGGYLDDVSVFAVECEELAYQNTPGGFCELWEAKDIADETFFEFSDLKPADDGEHLISLHVEDNEAYLCLAVANQDEPENTLINPEAEAGDTTLDDGELGQYLMVAGWYSDEQGNHLSPLFPATPIADLGAIAYADSSTGQDPAVPGQTEHVALSWCFGDLDEQGNCDGEVPNINETQTDQLFADLWFYAVQTRNNDAFSCDDVAPKVAEIEQ